MEEKPTHYEKLEITYFSDCSMVIMGDHVSKEIAKELMDKEDPDNHVEDVEHCWVRYEWMSDEDIEAEFTAEVERRPRWWVLYEQLKRPKGITRKATVIIPA